MVYIYTFTTTPQSDLIYHSYFDIILTPTSRNFYKYIPLISFIVALFSTYIQKSLYIKNKPLFLIKKLIKYLISCIILNAYISTGYIDRMEDWVIDNYDIWIWGLLLIMIVQYIYIYYNEFSASQRLIEHEKVPYDCTKKILMGIGLILLSLASGFCALIPCLLSGITLLCSKENYLTKYRYIYYIVPFIIAWASLADRGMMLYS